MNHNLVKILCAVCIMLFALPYLALAENGVDPYEDFYFIEPGPIERTILYADGSVVEGPTDIVTRPMIGSDLSNITPDEFKRMMIEGRKAAENNPNKIIVGGHTQGRGPTIIFNVISPPAGAEEALDSVSAYLARTFDDDITVTITVQFIPMGPGIIGGTSSYYGPVVTWANTRNGLQNGMDSDDTIQVWLPSGSTIPVRYIYGSGAITDETVCYFTKANYKATIGSVSGSDAFMQYNTDFTFDWDPSNGISGGTICFQSVAVHETGHALGFTSAADFRPNDIEALDIYRFQNTDDGGDYNPDTYSEFQTTARMVDKDAAGGSNDDVISDIISAEHRMSDGTPYQCSHFKQGAVYAIMQPAFSYGQTYYPNFLRTPDIDMFDAIGWDYPASQFTLSVYVNGSGYVTKDPNQTYYTYGQQVELTAHALPEWAFDEWTGDLTGSANPDTIVMDDDKTVTAHFMYVSVEENQTDNIQMPFVDIFPNPSSGAVKITYSMEQGNNVGGIIIYDVSGQVVRDLAINQFTNQPIHQIVWDGRNNAGKDLPSGVYLLKFKAGDYNETIKLLLLR